MLSVEKLNVGIVGIAGRPMGFISAIQNSKVARLTSVCDINYEMMCKATEGIDGINKYTDYYEMIQSNTLDAVIIGTPVHLHVPQSIIALENNIHVFSEVTAATSLDECKQLVTACKHSKASYMMGENCNYMKPYMIIKEMVKDGVFGEVYYAEGEYLHNCRKLIKTTPWRRKWQYGINGITYGTHSLGPIMSWFENDRIVKVSCVGSGHHYVDDDNKCFEMEDTCVMLAKTIKGRLIKIRMDIVSNRPYSLEYTLQGTKGCYDSKMTGNEDDKIWIEGLCNGGSWIDLNMLADKYTPELWGRYGAEASKEGHGGSDYIIMTDFIDAIVNNKPIPIGIHETMDMCLPGHISQQSILCAGEWIEVPDSREW
ncbi:MAG TPA: Gfo/Idh/MocA family oxidoreductase [Clostridiales bacterium]|nr:Gfo/Idh/MocA family oxidoreductase [Clostridiales bacterium]